MHATPAPLDERADVVDVPVKSVGLLSGGMTAIAAIAAVVGLLVTGAAAATLVADPGSVTRWGLPLVRVVVDISASITIGLLVVAAVVLPPQGAARARPASETGHRCETSNLRDPDQNAGRQQGTRSPVLGGSTLTVVRAAGVTGIAWAVAMVLQIVLTYARISGQSPSTPGFADQLARFLTQLELLRALTISALVAAVVASGAVIALRQATVGWLAVLALGGLLPIALTGHSAGSSDHELGVDSLAAHLVAVSVWVGGLVAVIVLRSSAGRGLPVVVARYSTLAGWSFAIVAVSGAVNGWVRVGGWADGWAGLGTRYGALVMAKALSLALLGLAGWWHRRRAVARLAEAAVAASTTARMMAAPFWRLVSGELVVMASAVGVAVAMANSAPPGQQEEVPSQALVLTGYPMPDPWTAASWVTSWRIDLLWTGVALVLAGLYLVGARRLARRGDRWSVLRTVSFVAGCAVLVWATSGAPGIHGRVLFSAHMLGHMTMSMVVPPLLVLGGPVTLALRALPSRRDGSRGAREWLLAVVHSRFLTTMSHPMVAASIFIGSLIVFYYSPLFSLALRTHTGHVLMHVHFLLAGYLFASVLVGVDPGPRRPAYPLRLVVLLAAMTFHAFFGVTLVTGSRLLAADVLGALDRTWGRSPLADQQYGGAIAWGVGELPALALAVGIAVAWARSDDREARRRDRQADRDDDAELRAYNDRLAQLADPGDGADSVRARR
ncbi:MAG: cytochrome c oxidase assembly protein [Angustibacter sp.]